MTILTVASVLAGVYLLVQVVMNYFARRELLALRMKNDLRQNEFKQKLTVLTQEINDAKLKYNNDLSKLNDAIEKSKPGLPGSN